MLIIKFWMQWNRSPIHRASDILHGHQNSQKHEKYHKCGRNQMHVCTTCLKLISAIGAISLPQT